MSAQDLEQRARELFEKQAEKLAAPWDRQWEPTKEYWRNKARQLLSQQPAPVNLEQFREAVRAMDEFIFHRERCGFPHQICDCGMKEARDRLLSIIDNAGKVASAEPVAWIRFRSDGGWEGPIHNCQIDEIRRSSGAWTPLYSAPHQPAPVVDDARMARALEAARCGLSPEHVAAIEEAISAYDPNCGARTVRVVDEAMRVDAERYRWLRDKGIEHDWTVCRYPIEGAGVYQQTRQSLDAAIDAARAQGVQS